MNAEELFQALSRIPENLREQLTVFILMDDCTWELASAAYVSYDDNTFNIE